MNKHLKIDAWKIIEEGFHPEENRITESLMSLGNGKMGQRANIEETYSGDSLQGNYIAGIYYPDKTRVGWWKNGYPEYFAKVLNSVHWIGLEVRIAGEIIDLAKTKILSFYRELNMKDGVLSRKVRIELSSGEQLEINSERFYSLYNDELAILKYSIKSIDFTGEVSIKSSLDFNVANEDSNYKENFWRGISTKIDKNKGFVKSKTKKTDFIVEAGMSHSFFLDNKSIDYNLEIQSEKQKCSHVLSVKLNENEELTLIKYASIVSSFYHDKKLLHSKCSNNLESALELGFDKLKKEQQIAWNNKWEMNDIVINGDIAAQQAMRFNIFQLNQTYTGADSRLNIGPKGFTGEKYGGSTYWDTEAYCIPFYLSTSDQSVSYNLLKYRYNHLGKAIENAKKLGFTDGAALFPMVTMNGEECHNEWEITFEEIHRNGAIAYAIYDYTNYTGDKSYLSDYGLEVLIGIARFWAQRVNFSEQKQKYVMLGVTGPNEYENNVNNNWYTNYLAVWCMKYTLEVLHFVRNENIGRFSEILDKTRFSFDEETDKWKKIIKNIYLPEDKEKGIFLQQENFLDKEISPASSLLKNEVPIHEHWSWDRILRSCYIKQADVLQGIFFFEKDFTKDEIINNFEFYEPITVHESSLSPCVHSILASAIGKREKAYEMFLRTARLDLDNMNNDTDDGCHITSMAGTWMAFVKGFGGMRVRDGKISFDAYCPEAWDSYSFRINYRGKSLKVEVDKKEVLITEL